MKSKQGREELHEVNSKSVWTVTEYLRPSVAGAPREGAVWAHARNTSANANPDMVAIYSPVPLTYRWRRCPVLPPPQTPATLIATSLPAIQWCIHRKIVYSRTSIADIWTLRDGRAVSMTVVLVTGTGGRMLEAQ